VCVSYDKRRLSDTKLTLHVHSKQAASYPFILYMCVAVCCSALRCVYHTIDDACQTPNQLYTYTAKKAPSCRFVLYVCCGLVCYHTIHNACHTPNQLYAHTAKRLPHAHSYSICVAVCCGVCAIHNDACHTPNKLYAHILKELHHANLYIMCVAVCVLHNQMILGVMDDFIALRAHEGVRVWVCECV